MKLTVYTINQNEEWDAVVRSFQSYDIYYLSGYVKAFLTHGDGDPLLFYYEETSDNSNCLSVRGINVVMKRDISKDNIFTKKIKDKTWFDFTTPYGYGGWVIEGDGDSSRLFDCYQSWCQSHNVVSEFVRFHPVLENSKINSKSYEVIGLGKTITMDLASKEQIWNDLSSKNRNVIRKARKSGVEIYWGRNPELIDTFIPLYNETMNKDDATDYYYFSREFYKSVLEDLRYNSLIFYALYDQKVISMSMILFGNENMHYHLSASDRKHQNLAATNLLLYEAACWGSENGYKSFHLGGGLGSKEDSLFKFKKAFNKNSKTYFSIGKKIFDQEKYKYLSSINCELKNSLKERSFFPEYRG